MKIEDLEITNNTQNLYDNFNNFIISEDSRVFNKLVARTLIYDSIKDIPGDIVECGVFKGSGFFTFLKLKKVMNPNSAKKVLGFDYFNTNNLSYTPRGLLKRSRGGEGRCLLTSDFKHMIIPI